LKNLELPDIVNDMTYLAVSICGRDISDFEAQMKSAVAAGAEMLELRFDYLAELSVAAVTKILSAARGTSLPLLATCRDAAQGGNGNWNLKQRGDILAAAVLAGANFVDCEFSNFTDAATRQALLEALNKNPRCRLVLSAHHFDRPFDDIELLYESIISFCPQAIPKLVYTARHINDCFAAFDLLHDKDRDAIVFSMGAMGQVSRILAKKLGSFLTFAAMDEQQASAPGQIPIAQMKGLYRWDTIDAETEIFGIIGDPVGHSLSPAIHNAGFAKDAINAIYLPFWVQNDKAGFDAFMEHILSRPWMGFRGFSVTIPHKTDALDFAEAKGDYVEPLAATIGAVNTFKVGFNSLVSAFNTDYTGAMDALTHTLGIDRHRLHSQKIAVLGAGGVSRAVVAGLVDAGAEVTIYNRTQNKGQTLAEEFRCRWAGLDTLENLQADIVVNCTSIGMTPNVDATPLPAALFRPEMTAFDTIYTPLKTQFLRDAAAAGAKCVNGAEMFIRQAMAQYHIFTGHEPDEKTIRKVVFEKLEAK
jgi:3-dehydroquinate dehydratase/shikimate dehydrogenase